MSATWVSAGPTTHTHTHTVVAVGVGRVATPVEVVVTTLAAVRADGVRRRPRDARRRRQTIPPLGFAGPTARSRSTHA